MIFLDEDGHYTVTDTDGFLLRREPFTTEQGAELYLAQNSNLKRFYYPSAIHWGWNWDAARHMKWVHAVSKKAAWEDIERRMPGIFKLDNIFEAENG